MITERDPIKVSPTFRDEIAMRVLPVLVANYHEDSTVDNIKLSAWAYNLADELIRARGGPPPSRYGKKS